MPHTPRPASTSPLRERQLARTFALALTAALATLGAACSGGNSGSTTGGTGGTTTTTTETTTGGAGGTTTTPSGGTGGTGGDPGCQSDAECPGQVCNTSNGLCVACTPEKDVCQSGQFCTPADVCQVGCTDNTDCAAGTKCDVTIHACVGCIVDTDCAVGSICISDTCVPGCSGIQPCQPGFSCCSQLCVDLANDTENCGLCNNPCSPPDNGIAVCENSSCTLGTCNAGWADCNLDPVDGCERNIVAEGPCICTPGDTKACYSGGPGTENIGLCHGGTSTCQEGVA